MINVFYYKEYQSTGKNNRVSTESTVVSKTHVETVSKPPVVEQRSPQHLSSNNSATSPRETPRESPEYQNNLT